MVCDAYGSASIGYEVGTSVVFLQRIPLQDYFHRRNGSGFGDLRIFYPKSTPPSGNAGRTCDTASALNSLMPVP